MWRSLCFPGKVRRMKGVYLHDQVSSTLSRHTQPICSQPLPCTCEERLFLFRSRITVRARPNKGLDIPPLSRNNARGVRNVRKAQNEQTGHGDVYAEIRCHY